MGSLACHGYLIDEMWLISSSECFLNKTLAPTGETTQGADATATAMKGATGAAGADESGWTAELSYEHYGEQASDGDASEDRHDDGHHKLSAPIGPSNRRNINEILMQAHPDGGAGRQLNSPIVLAKLEEPVRFR